MCDFLHKRAGEPFSARLNYLLVDADVMELATFIPDNHEVEIYVRCKEMLNGSQPTQSTQPFGNDEFIFFRR